MRVCLEEVELVVVLQSLRKRFQIPLDCSGNYRARHGASGMLSGVACSCNARHGGRDGTEVRGAVSRRGRQRRWLDVITRMLESFTLVLHCRRWHASRQ